MPLKKGSGSIRYNVGELMNQPIQSASRRKAILTIAKKNGISVQEARFRQAKAIAISQSKKK